MEIVHISPEDIHNTNHDLRNIIVINKNSDWDDDTDDYDLNHDLNDFFI